MQVENYRRLSYTQLTFAFSASGVTLYHILGVPKGADEDDIKRAYRKVILGAHRHLFQ